MISGKKTISSSLRPQIELCKGHILTSGGRWFDADGYVGKTAVRELRQSGTNIEYDPNRQSYRVVKLAERAMRLTRLLDESSDSLLRRVESLAGEFVTKSQELLDSWDQSDPEFGDPELGFGGICQDIADGFCDICSAHDIDCIPVDNNGMGDQHVWAIAYDEDTGEAVSIDINPYTYERGSGYTWTKIEGVVLGVDDVQITKTDYPKELIEEY